MLVFELILQRMEVRSLAREGARILPQCKEPDRSVATDNLLSQQSMHLLCRI